jgi:2-keto-3-deoxy-L-rhamnonate aldolase RhmA
MKNMISLLQEEGVLLGTFVLSNSPAVVEMVCLAGFHFVLIDCEHSATNPFGSELELMIRAADSRGIPAVVRVLNSDYGQISKALDFGAQGIVVPHICNEKEMEEAVRAAARPPRGRRGAAPVVRAASYGMGDWQEYLRLTRHAPFIGPLIEDIEGVEKADEILSVQGVDIVWFGAFDLAVSMCKEDPRHRDEDIEGSRRAVYEAAKTKGIAIADYAWDGTMAKELIDLGARVVAVSNDISVLGNALRDLVKSVRY